MCVCVLVPARRRGRKNTCGKKRHVGEKKRLEYRALDIHLTAILSSDANLAPADHAALDHELALLCAYCWCQAVSGKDETWCKDIHTRDADTH